MPATSKHYGDVANWIEKVIESCTHPKQEKTAMQLVNNFTNQLARLNVDQQVYFELSRRLNIKLFEHFSLN